MRCESVLTVFNIEYSLYYQRKLISVLENEINRRYKSIAGNKTVAIDTFAKVYHKNDYDELAAFNLGAGIAWLIMLFLYAGVIISTKIKYGNEIALNVMFTLLIPIAITGLIFAFLLGNVFYNYAYYTYIISKDVDSGRRSLERVNEYKGMLYLCFIRDALIEKLAINNTVLNSMYTQCSIPIEYRNIMAVSYLLDVVSSNHESIKDPSIVYKLTSDAMKKDKVDGCLGNRLICIESEILTNNDKVKRLNAYINKNSEITMNSIFLNIVDEKYELPTVLRDYIKQTVS